MSDVGNYFAKPYKTLLESGFKITVEQGWVPVSEEVRKMQLEKLRKDPKFISAFILFFGADVTSQLLNANRQDVIFADGIAMTPAEKGTISVYQKTVWESRVKEKLKSIERETEAFVRSSKEASAYSNRMKGRVLEWFGADRGHGGKSASEIEMEGSYKALVAHISALRSYYGVRKDMRDKLYALMTTLLNIDLQNIEVGIQDLKTAKIAAIVAPFIPIVIWAAPYVGAIAIGDTPWVAALGESGAKLYLYSMAVATGTSAIAAGIRTAHLGGGFLCNFYEQFSDRSAKALIAAPFMAAIPVILAGGAGAATLASGSICAKTSYGILNLGLSVGAVSWMAKSGIQGLNACYEQVQSANKAGEDGNMDLVNIHAEKAYQTCAEAGIDLGFAAVVAGKLTLKTYEAIRSKSWQPLVGSPCGKGFGLVDGDCGPGTPRENEQPATAEELQRLVPESGKLHTNISNTERWNVIKNVPLEKTTSAPGHDYLRLPESVVSMGKQIAASNNRGFTIFQKADKIVLNVYTDAHANVKAIEVLDGNHRFAAGLYAEKLAPGKGWARLGDIPKEFVDIRINGFNTNGQKLPRWIPLHIVEASKIPRDQWRFIPPEWGAKGPTAEISGDIASTSSQFKPEHRGVSLMQVLRTSLERINVSL